MVHIADCNVSTYGLIPYKHTRVAPIWETGQYLDPSDDAEVLPVSQEILAVTQARVT